MKRKQLQQSPPQPPRDSVLMTIPEAAAYSGLTVFKIRTACRSGMLRHSQESPYAPYLITREAIRDYVHLMELDTKARREARLAKLAHKKQPHPEQPHPDLVAASERGRQAARELMGLMDSEPKKPKN